MRILSLIFTLLVVSVAATGAEVTADIDRCVILNAENDNTAESKIAVYFDFPNQVSGKEIIYAELHIPITLQENESDSLYELILFPMMSDWTENNIDYENADADSLSAGAYTILLGGADEFHIDITSFIMELAGEDRTNYGLIAVGDLLGEDNFQLSENLDQSIKNNAVVRIVYK